MADLARARELAEAGLTAIDMAVRSASHGHPNPHRARQAAHALRAAADELVPLRLDAAVELPAEEVLP